LSLVVERDFLKSLLPDQAEAFGVRAVMHLIVNQSALKS
jgi:hypothetical protein